MTDRDRLVEQISNAMDKFEKMCTEWVMNESYDYIPFAEFVADYLLANGVIVQKQGKLIKTEEPLGWRDVECIECSVCRESWVIDEYSDFEDYSLYWNYCPECGAKLKECEG